MKKFMILALIVMFNFPALAASVFIEGLEDVPVMEGLQQIPTDTISFGNEESRLVEVLLTGSKTGFKKVESFYKSTLPQMGWVYQGRRESTLVFEREGEVLEISRESDKPLRILITVKSKI